MRQETRPGTAGKKGERTAGHTAEHRQVGAGDGLWKLPRGTKAS